MPPDAAARFRADVARLLRRVGEESGPSHPSTNHTLRPELVEGRVPGTCFDRLSTNGSSWTSDRLALAVSGGPDSMAMLALAHAAFPGRVAAATFDHRLRAASAAEAAMVAEACATIGVPHATLVPDAPIAGASLQRQAREARYRALSAWAGTCPLLTAHHADDQAETLLMRLNRASGLSGLAAIRAVRFEGATPVLRPLLGWRRTQLRGIVIAAGWRFVDDPANADPRHDRTRIRALLSQTPALDAAALAASATWLGEAEEVIAGSADALWVERWQAPVLDAADLPRDLRRRLLRRAIAAIREAHAIVAPAFTESANVEASLDTLEGGRACVQGGVIVRPKRTGWTFAPAPPRRSA